ncbi:MAG: adenine phosphoribosyltransferase [Nitrospinota bacterium]|jgi:adenine phosphoribosyltransferase|nr:adenine phosphoribosyltransferase [Nitrospinota bacterium]MDP7169042.1 adenine phosphoribosyltransferase [Nitrospinota bacterium]MDP7371995.1 adenine phosphoribosyltransferase [Nitrospinota bacterium]MDP7505497.1 adenine phosphoribosyltransferase [Nitrospinota bacterium]MDP7663685.1 adenine phosphoribosyltransferase [Nitrospinota bacterium]
MSESEELIRHIRDVPDFPKEGIIFKDITPMLQDAKAFQTSVDLLADRYMGEGVDVVVGAEARGFIIASPLAYKLGAGFVLIRKPGKLPWNTESETYELEYGEDALEIHKDAIQPGMKVLIADDLLATGGTAQACVNLVERLGGDVVGMSFFIELSFLNGRDNFGEYPVHSLIQY